VATPHPSWLDGSAVPDDRAGAAGRADRTGEAGDPGVNGYRTRRERRAAEAAARSDGSPAGPFAPSVPARGAADVTEVTAPVRLGTPSAARLTPAPGEPTTATSPLSPVPSRVPSPLPSRAPSPLRARVPSPPAPRPGPLPGSPGPPPPPHDGAAVLAAGAPPAPRGATLSPGTAPRASLGRRLLRDTREVLGTVAIALGIAIVIKTFLIQPFYIPSQSMEDTLLVGDRVLVSKLEPGPFELNRGDIAVFVDPGGWLTAEAPEPSLLNRALTFVGLLPANSGEHLIKRVVGLPGDTVRCCDPEGRLLVNNQPLDESPYLFPGDSPSSLDFEVVVPEGTVWVMGDHRSVSEDSRYHDVDGDFTAGAVPIDNVVGRAVLVMWPLSRLEWLGVPDGVFDGVGGQLDGVR